MSENLSQPQGKGLGVAGFVTSLIGVVLAFFVAGIATLSYANGGSLALLYFWVVFCAGSVVLSAMGMSKLGKTGGKKGLAIAGLVIGLVALVWTVVLLMGVEAAASLGMSRLR
jgi:hypothetical protein